MFIGIYRFDDCKQGNKGVMPYCEGENSIQFVWVNSDGFGRIETLHLTKKGKIAAWRLFKELKIRKSKQD